MSAQTFRLLLVLSLALMASLTRGSQKGGETPAAPSPQWAGFGWAPVVPVGEAERSVRIIYSDEEVDIVDSPSAPANQPVD